MYKFIAVVFVLSAIYPQWPVDAISGSQAIVADFQSRTILVDLTLPE
jgi:hypothetical protein